MPLKKLSTKNIISIFIAIFFVVCVIAPLISMLLHITPEGFNSVLHSAQFADAVKNSISTSLISTILSLILSFVSAWCLERTNMKLKAFFEVVFILPMLIPSISHAFGLVSLCGANGVITKALGLEKGIYGFWGIVLGSVMYSFPAAFLMFSSILKYEDGSSYRAAEVLGINRLHRFFGITLPYLKRTFISAFFAVFTMVITDYGVPLMIGGKTVTLSVLLYNKAVSMIDYNTGSVIGAFLLIPTIAAFVVDLINPENGQATFVSEKVPIAKGISTVFAYIYSFIMCICVISPIVSFCFMVFETKYPIDSSFTLSHIEKTLNKGAGEYLMNSLIYSVLAACIGTVFAFICSYITARLKGTFSKGLHLFSITSMAIPGIVLGLSYVMFFNGTAIYGTLLIVVLVNIVHFFASPYLIMYNTLEKLNPNLEDVGLSLGVGRIRIIKDVIIPKVKGSLSEMFVYFFVNSMMTISAVSFLAPPAPKTLSLMINQFEAQLLMESAAFVSLLILIVNLAIKLLFQIRKKS